MQPSRMLLAIGLVASLVIFGSSYSTDTSSNDYLSNDIRTSFAMTSSHYNQTSVPGNETRNGTIPTSPNFPNPSDDTTGNLTRARRNADPLSEYSHKLSTVARISNGISLLAGLINGNIPVDSVIQELLNFGDVKVQDVLALDKNKVDAALKELEDLPGKLSSVPSVLDLEKGIIAMDRLKKAYEPIGDFSQYKIPTAYFNLAGNFNPNPNEFGAYQSVATAITEALDQFEKIRTAKITETDYAQTGSYFIKLIRDLDQIEGGIGKFKQVIQVFDNLDGLFKPEESFKPITTMLALSETLTQAQIIPSKAAEFSSNMNAVISLSTTLNAAKTDLINVGGLASGLTHKSVTKRQFTPGFVKGASDLKLLASDIRDPSVEQTIGTGKNFARLSGGLKPLETLSSKLNPVETKLRPIAAPPVIGSSKAALQLHSSISNFQAKSSDVSSTFTSLGQCTFRTPSNGVISSTVQINDDVRKLAKNLATLKSLATLISTPPPELAEVKTVLGPIPSSISQAVVERLAKGLKDASGKVEAVKTFFTKIDSELKSAPKVADVKTLAGKIVGAKQHVQDFLDNPAVQSTTTGLNCVKNNKGPIEGIALAAKAIQLVREFKKDDVTNIKTAVETISQASGLIKEIQNVPNAMKTNKAAEVTELVAMKKSKETATTLGFAAGSIRSMDGLRGLQASVDTLKNDKLFDAEVKKLTDPKKSEILQKYGDHKVFVTALEASISQINTFKSNLAVPKDLKKLGAPLTAAKSVPSVPGSIQGKSEALGMLISEVTDPQTKTNLQALKDHMDQLGALDLNFASGHTSFAQAPAALQGLFTFLTDFLTPKQTAGAAGSAGSNTSDSAGFNMLILVYIGAALLVIVVIVVIAYFVYVHNRNKKKRAQSTETPSKSSPATDHSKIAQTTESKP